MVHNIATEVRIAKKDHHDDSAEFIIESMKYMENWAISGDRIGEWKQLLSN